MRLSDAKKLINGDQVKIKAKATSSRTREVVTVAQAYPLASDPAIHLIEAMTGDGYRTLTHNDIL